MRHGLFRFQKKFVRLIFFSINLVFILWFSFISVVLYSDVLKGQVFIIPRPIVVLVISLICFLALFGFYKLSGLKSVRCILRKPYFPVVIFLITVLTRWAWILLYGNVELDSDYALYMHLASSIAEKGQIPVDYQWYVSFAPYVLGYSTFLSVLISIFGNTLAVVQGCNILLSGFVAVILFLLGKKINGREEIGVIASAFWIGMPAMAGMTSLPETELLFIALLLAATYVCLHLSNQRFHWVSWALFLFAAVLLILMNEIRPLGLLVLLAFVVYLLITSRYMGKAAILKMLRVVIVLLIFILSVSISNGIKERFLGTEIARNSYGFGLYLGLNYESNGSWNPDDAAFVTQAIEKGDSASYFHQQMIDRSVQRFADLAEQNRLSSLVYHKASIFWSHPNGFLDWISVLMEANYYKRIILGIFDRASNYLYFVVILLSLIECLLSPLRKDYRYHSQIFFIKVMLFVYCIALTVFDNNARYIVPVIPLFFLLAASGLQTMQVVYEQWRNPIEKSAILFPEDR